MAKDQIIALGDTEEDTYNNLAGTIKEKFKSFLSKYQY